MPAPHALPEGGSPRGCCTPIQKRTPPPLRSRMGVMKRRLANAEPSLRKLCRYVSDSCRASSAADMCETASCCGKPASILHPSVLAGFVSTKEGDWRKRQLRCMTSCGAQPHMTPKPAEANTIGFRCSGSAALTDGSVTRQLSSENFTNVYRSQSPKPRASMCRCMYGSERWTSRKATATDEERGPLHARGSTYARQKSGAPLSLGRITSIRTLRCAATASCSSFRRELEASVV
mmetsp:Transcript_43462/g.114208  ORF Transcript_43462/g.114208 Transcript_43462/m.114208 type:complete len:234 (-) Transcript_43462:1192-1893(-)